MVLTEGTVFVLGRRVRPGADGLVVEVREVDGLRTMFAYSSLQRLVDGCGKHQPWLELKVGVRAEDVQVDVGADVVAWNAHFPASLRQVGGDDA
ncbi:SAV_915 family protein [Actinokineospora sp. UTMC 2448]|uniref:SAV_915 family protein n=1 Tax=Actinokineospora sp. UTMC 2448 TaxID=2268449 RepID=UPI002164B963|nr:SAV_915 family protein [Actinokineospora sp. UTMC 2448]